MGRRRWPDLDLEQLHRAGRGQEPGGGLGHGVLAGGFVALADLLGRPSCGRGLGPGLGLIGRTRRSLGQRTGRRRRRPGGASHPSDAGRSDAVLGVVIVGVGGPGVVCDLGGPVAHPDLEGGGGGYAALGIGIGGRVPLAVRRQPPPGVGGSSDSLGGYHLPSDASHHPGAGARSASFGGYHRPLDACHQPGPWETSLNRCPFPDRWTPGGHSPGGATARRALSDLARRERSAHTWDGLRSRQSVLAPPEGGHGSCNSFGPTPQSVEDHIVTGLRPTGSLEGLWLRMNQR